MRYLKYLFSAFRFQQLTAAFWVSSTPLQHKSTRQTMGNSSINNVKDFVMELNNSHLRKTSQTTEG